MSSSPGPLKGLTVTTEDNIEHDLFGGTVRLMHLDGTGIPQVNRNLQKIALAHGAIDRGFKIEPRQMVLTLAAYGKDAAEMYPFLDQITNIFSPTDNPLILKATREDNVSKSIECFLNGSLDYPMSTRIGGLQVVVVPLICPDPIWYDPTQVVQTAGFTAGVSAVTVANSNWSWFDYPVLKIKGPMVNPSIVLTPQTISFALTATLASGEEWELDFRTGYKTITKLSDSSNQFSTINYANITAFNLFRIESKKMLAALNNDHNSIQTTATGTDGTSLVTLSFYKRYLSL